MARPKKIQPVESVATTITVRGVKKCGTGFAGLGPDRVMPGEVVALPVELATQLIQKKFVVEVLDEIIK